MTTEQEERLQAMEGKLGDERQFEAITERTNEIIEQSFSLIRIISGNKNVSVLPGNNPFINYVE
jgi:hypothetical protein